MDYLRLFNNESQYNLEKYDFEYPTVSKVKSPRSVKWMEKPHDYSQDYLAFEALESGTFTFTMTAKLPTTCVPSISYSIDNGETWSTTANVDNEEVIVTTPTINQGNKVLWKSEAVQFCSNPDQYPGGNIGYGSFTSSGNYNVCGNIMSLIYGDNFIENNTFKQYVSTGYGAGAFAHLFSNNTKLLSIKYLILPAITLASYCYSQMFYGCTNLTTAPTLPATTLTNYCYSAMFSGCTSLVNAPELSATTLTDGCYNSMFYGCIGLTSAPELPATTLATSCYQGMFYGCILLTTAPVLPAITLESSCYSNMFTNCSSLNYIKAMFTTTPSTTHTGGWVSGVAATGTFVKNSEATWTTTGNNGVPSGWTVETASE